MIAPDGSLDRAALGARVFGDESALARLNAIVHPAVREESAARFSAAFAADPGSASLAIGHHTLGSGDNGHTQTVHDLR